MPSVLHTCAGFDWDNFLHRSYDGAIFWIRDGNGDVLLLLRSTYAVKALPAPHTTPPMSVLEVHKALGEDHS